MVIRKANINEYKSVREFYHSLIDGIENRPYGAGWKKDIYPAPDYLMDSIRDGQLYIAVENETIVSAMVVNHDCNEGYREFAWPTDASEEEVTVIHALGVHPTCTRRGNAKKMVRFVIDNARKSGQKAIRLDVLKGNLPAEKLYSGLGFQYLYTLPMFYEDTGWTDYELFEYQL